MIEAAEAVSLLEILELRQGEVKDLKESLENLAALCRGSDLREGATILRPHEVLSVALSEYAKRRSICVDRTTSLLAEGSAVERSSDGIEPQAGMLWLCYKVAINFFAIVDDRLRWSFLIGSPKACFFLVAALEFV
jgi:hypothetical protein